jgi:type II secretory pathway pseudopilin PulG
MRLCHLDARVSETRDGKLALPRRRFTLIELVTVMAIIMILASMLMPVLGKALRKARSVRCTSSMNAWHTALETFADDNGESYPGVTFWGQHDRFRNVDAAAEAIHTSFAQYLERDTLMCSARTEPRQVASAPIWPLSGASAEAIHDYWVFFGLSTRTPTDPNYIEGGWTGFYWTKAIAQNMGPVLRRNQNHEGNSPMVMDRMWTTKTVSMNEPCIDGSQNSYGSDGTNGIGCGAYTIKAGNQISNHNVPGQRVGEGTNILFHDGSAEFFYYSPGEVWDYYVYDYYNCMQMPPEIFGR